MSTSTVLKLVSVSDAPVDALDDLLLILGSLGRIQLLIILLSPAEF